MVIPLVRKILIFEEDSYDILDVVLGTHTCKVSKTPHNDLGFISPLFGVYYVVSSCRTT